MKANADRKNQAGEKSASRGKSVAELRENNYVPEFSRALGNQGLRRLFGADPRRSQPVYDGAETSQFSHAAVRKSLANNPPLTLQAKLTVNAPGDSFEQEADRAAEQVMRTSDSQVQRKCGCDGGNCSKCEKEQGGQRVQTKRTEGSASAGMAVPPVVTEALNSPGQPLDSSTRAFMEPRFRHDFSRVRVHTDAKAADAAAAIEANAFTFGENLVFGARQYAPTTLTGKSLLAHELAHVVQQGAGRLLIQRQTCPKRPTDEVNQSRTAAGILASNVELNLATNQLDIVDFAINSGKLPPKVTSDPNWERAMSLIVGDPSMHIAVTGFTDCVGSNSENLSLRQARTKALIAAMPAKVKAKILFSFTFVTTDFIDTNTTAVGRARNRSVRVTFSSVPPAKQDACDMLKHANNLDEYLFLVRCMEKRLGLTAANQTQTALSVLRQIYYGSAPWSQSQNKIWDSVITQRPWSPGTDPTAALKLPLMSALQLSQIVEGTDIGHILTGLDAMLAPQNVKVTKGPFGVDTGIANEEWATWAGDVGSAAAEWALDALLVNPKMSNPATFFKRFASDEDLSGDIDSFAIRAGSGGAKPPAQLAKAVSLTGPLSEALLQYFRITSSPLKISGQSRIQNFIEAYGGIVTSRKLTNRAALIARLAPTVEKFAQLFAFQRLFLKPGPTAPGALSFDVLLKTGIDQMTAKFVDWLEAKL